MSQSIREDIAGVIALLRRDKAWQDKMDLSAEGVFRSFWAIAIALPFYLIMARVLSKAAMEMLRQSPDFTEGSFPELALITILIIEALAFLTIWLGSIGLLDSSRGSTRSPRAGTPTCS